MADLDIAPIAYRRCSRCGLSKPQDLYNFHFDRKRQVWGSRCRPCATAAAQEHYWANPERKRAYARDRYKANPEPAKALTRQWCLDNPERNREIHRLYAVKWRAALKERLLDGYGHRCSCCGLTESEWLTLEHVHRDGSAHRKKLGGQIAVYRELERLGWPTSGYCLLCWNCQLSSWYGGACAHTPDYRPSQPKHRAAREAVIAGYGGRCECCGLTEPAGFLCVEHVDRDGKAHRLATGGNVYRDLVRRGFPAGVMILCYNCQMARAFHGSCPHERGRQLALRLGGVE
jgi:hypothetical protein